MFVVCRVMLKKLSYVASFRTGLDINFVIFLIQKAGIALLWRQQKKSMKRTPLVFLNE